jgi:hypothetical protein
VFDLIARAQFFQKASFFTDGACTPAEVLLEAQKVQIPENLSKFISLFSQWLNA